MTQKKYQSKIKKVKYQELVGGIICIVGLIFIGFNFNKLDSVFLQSIGVITIILLMIMPTLSFLSWAHFNSEDDFDRPYIDIVKRFANQKLRFLKYQKINTFLNYLLLVTMIILSPKFFYGTDIIFNKYFWIVAFSVGYIFLLFFSKWVKKCYGTSLKQAEELLKDMEPKANQL